jgi:hypothetical protein
MARGESHAGAKASQGAEVPTSGPTGLAQVPKALKVLLPIARAVEVNK